MRQQNSAFLAIFLLVTLSSASSVLANTDNLQEPTSVVDVSHARVVSLSLVEGTVIARRPGSPNWGRATLNMPIQQGVSIATARHSFAEVQFKNGSTVRVGELSRVDFMQMGPAPHSGYVNHLTLAFGFATTNIIPGRHDEYVLTASGASLVPYGKTEFRADLSHRHLRVEVFNGRVRAADSSQSEELRKNQLMACDYSARGVFKVTDTIQMDEWDKWVQARDRQSTLAAYSGPGPGMYDWENSLIPFSGMGLLPGGFGADGF